MSRSLRIGPATVLWTGGADGHLGHSPPRSQHDDVCCGPEAVDRRRAVHHREWIHLTQVHGNKVVVVDDGNAVTAAGTEADAAVTNMLDVTLAIATADCAPIALVGDNGVVGAVHAGWRGLQQGVVQEAVDAMGVLGAENIVAALGPCIGPECYEFSDEMLTPIEDKWGSAVRSVTSTGTTALDMRAAVASACESAGVDMTSVTNECTACSGDYYSFRAKGDDSRQVMLVWLEP